MGDVTVSSTTDDLAKVRAAAGLQEELTEQEKQEQTEQQEFEHARTENGNAPQRDRRMYVLASKWREAERERDELRQRLAEVERNQANAPLDRVLAAEYRAAELEEKLRAYEHGGGVAYANPPPDSTEATIPAKRQRSLAGIPRLPGTAQPQTNRHPVQTTGRQRTRRPRRAYHPGNAPGRQ